MTLWRFLRIKDLFAFVVVLALGAAVAHGQVFQFGGKKPATILFDENDHKVVGIAADAFAGDVELITGKRPKIGETSQNAVIIGTLGKSKLIDELRREGKIKPGGLADQRESFLLQIVDNPIRGVDKALVIAGSDRRGTAFGVFEVSQRIGVSPWVWWADSNPEKDPRLELKLKTYYSPTPSVKYRGVFINDEDWGFEPWARQTFEPENGGPGPKTYAKLFELLLRLKANACWPAMHEVTRPFNSDPRNARVADDYAIVMGSSHAEPMLRNNVGEWKDAKESFNFLTNEAGVTNYWEERAKTNAGFESVWTIGMRGIHDSAIQGPKTQPERIATLEKIFAVQRSLLEKYSGKRADEIPQIFCPYKEVLDDYRGGLKVPDDVTIVFPDDNFGYIRYFPTAAEQKRKGGFGVYYHISYLGRPMSYLWLNSTPPALIFEEMSKAYANGMRDFWMLNVGDLKPGEIGAELFMQMAYDARKWTSENQQDFLQRFFEREFGEVFDEETTAIMDDYYRLGSQRKPEHLQWFMPKTAARRSELSDDEIVERLATYKKISDVAESIVGQMRNEKKNAYYELVVYPVKMAAAVNEQVFAAELAVRHKATGNPDAILWARRSIAASKTIESETRFFNESLAGGKWRGIMSPEMTAGQWPSFRSTLPRLDEKDFESSAFVADAAAPSTVDRSVSKTGDFVERDGAVSIDAGNFSSRSISGESRWAAVRGLGRTGNAMTVFPQTAATFAGLLRPRAMYRFRVEADGEFDVKFDLVPTHPLPVGNSNELRFAIAFDDDPDQTLVADGGANTALQSWADIVLNGAVQVSSRVTLKKGIHTLTIFALETGVVIDKIVLSRGKLPASYLGPPETR